MTRARIYALAAAAGAFLLDLAVERALRAAFLHDGMAVLVPGFLDLRFAWNRGISFSLFTQSSPVGNWLLSGFLAILIVALIVAVLRTRRALMAAGLGSIIGGALGNLSDRVLHGAVFDFLYLHIGRLPLFVCNTADIAISLGVLCIAADAFYGGQGPSR